METVRSIICDVLGVSPEDVQPEARIVADLGADSLDAMQIVMECEERLSITVSDEEAERLATVADVVKFVTERRALPVEQ